VCRHYCKESIESSDTVEVYQGVTKTRAPPLQVAGLLPTGFWFVVCFGNTTRVPLYVNSSKDNFNSSDCDSKACDSSS